MAKAKVEKKCPHCGHELSKTKAKTKEIVEETKKEVKERSQEEIAREIAAHERYNAAGVHLEKVKAEYKKVSELLTEARAAYSKAENDYHNAMNDEDCEDCE
jgi:peptide subunit release factor 1 (eRF1)